MGPFGLCMWGMAPIDVNEVISSHFVVGKTLQLDFNHFLWALADMRLFWECFLSIKGSLMGALGV